MVCAKCESKLQRLIVADKWKGAPGAARKTTSSFGTAPRPVATAADSAAAASAGAPVVAAVISLQDQTTNLGADRQSATASSGVGTTTVSASGPVKSGGGPPSHAAGGPLGLALRACRLCKSKCHLAGAYYCHSCAYKNGICAMCGTKVLETSGYKMSSR